MSSTDNPIVLESNPLEKDYEDYVSAYFQSGGLYVERSIIHREKEEIMELDIILTDFSKENAYKKLVEIKSGGWGFSEIFKVKGWLVYLKMEDGVFIVKQSKESFDYFEGKAEELGIKLINNSDLSKTNDVLSDYLHQPADDKEIETLRFSYLLERKLLKQIKNGKKNNPDLESYKKLDDYFFKVNSGSFFSSKPKRRIKQLFKIYLKYKNITAKVAHELKYGTYDDEVTELPDEEFKKIFYRAEDSPLHIAMYIEHIARITIIKSCILQILKEKQEEDEFDFNDLFDSIEIPKTIKTGLEEISTDPYFHRYPIFWQFFTFVMGGFILTDLEEREYEYISKNTGIPVEEIPNAFDSFNKLFPKSTGWMMNLHKSNISWHRFFPLPFSGIGANHRRFIYVEKKPEGKKIYDELEKLLSGDKTMIDLTKWNNLAYRTLKVK